MNDTDQILAELRKLSAWAEMQRRMTKWMLIGAGVLVVFGLIGAFIAEALTKKVFTELAPVERPEWYTVDERVRHGEFDKALALGETLIVKTPLYPEAHRRLAGAYLAAGKLDQARKHYAEAFRLFPCEENENLLTAIKKRVRSEQPNTADGVVGKQTIPSATDQTSATPSPTR